MKQRIGKSNAVFGMQMIGLCSLKFGVGLLNSENCIGENDGHFEFPLYFCQ